MRTSTFLAGLSAFNGFGLTAAGVSVTSTISVAETATITSCSPEVTDCPGRKPSTGSAASVLSSLPAPVVHSDVSPVEDASTRTSSWTVVSPPVVAPSYYYQLSSAPASISKEEGGNSLASSSKVESSELESASLLAFVSVFSSIPSTPANTSAASSSLGSVALSSIPLPGAAAPQSSPAYLYSNSTSPFSPALGSGLGGNSGINGTTPAVTPSQPSAAGLVSSSGTLIMTFGSATIMNTTGSSIVAVIPTAPAAMSAPAATPSGSASGHTIVRGAMLGLLALSACILG